jgi:hypothetical protein
VEIGMTDHPMLFSAPMILALQREAKEPGTGTGKTQTRRGLKLAPDDKLRQSPFSPSGLETAHGQPVRLRIHPGDRVWCRETVRAVEMESGLDCVEYAADGSLRAIESTQEASDRWIDLAHYRGKRNASVNSIHMPRWASRLTLYVSEVRVPRLQEIRDADARAEGVCFDPSLPADVHRCRLDLDPRTKGADWLTDWSAKDVYRQLWEHLNGPGSWAENPWVACYSFKLVLANIDSLEG